MNLHLEPRDFVAARLFESEDAVIQAALHLLMQSSPENRLALAIHLYDAEPGITLARAAEIADVSMAEMKEILLKHGGELRIGPATIEDAEKEIQVALRWQDANAD